MGSKRLTTYHEDVQFDAAFMEEYFDSDCQWLVALNDWQLSVILSAVRYAHWPSRWVNYSDWSEIFWKVQELEHCLMAGCNVGDLLDKFDLLIATFTGPSGETFASMFNLVEEELAGINAELTAMTAATGLIASNTDTVNKTLNESFNLYDGEHGGLENNINERLKNLNITTGGLIDAVDLIGVAENLGELNKIRESLQSLVIREDGNNELLSISDLIVRLTKSLDSTRDNLDLVIQDSDDETPKEYSITAILHQMMFELTNRVDKIRDNLDVFVSSEEKEFGIAALINGMALYAFEMQNSLRCVADATNSECPEVTEPTHYLQEGQTQEDDYATELTHDWEMINDPDEGGAEVWDEFIQTLDFASPPGSITEINTLLVKSYSTEPEGENHILSIDILASGFVEIWISTDDLAVPWKDTVRTELQQNFLTEEWEWFASVEIYNNDLYQIPDYGTFHLTDAATGVTTVATWEPQE
jgi:hypothetical protein